MKRSIAEEVIVLALDLLEYPEIKGGLRGTNWSG